MVLPGNCVVELDSWVLCLCEGGWLLTGCLERSILPYLVYQMGGTLAVVCHLYT